MHASYKEQFLTQSMVQPSEKIFMALVTIFMTALVTTNLIAGKTITLVGLHLSAGVLIYPFTFVVIAIIAEIYGTNQAKLVILMGFIVSIITTSLVWIVHQLPIAPSSLIDQMTFNQTLGLLPDIVFSSLIAYLVAQFVDLKLFTYLSKLFHYQHLWLRNSAAKLVSQLLDSILVVTIAWVIWPQVSKNQQMQPIAFDTWQTMVIGQYLFKAVFALLETPLVYGGIYLVKKQLKNRY